MVCQMNRPEPHNHPPFSSSTVNALLTSLSWLYKAFPFNKQKTQSILMKTFVVFTSCKVTLSSGKGSLNTLRVFDLAVKLGFLVFLFCRDFSPQKRTAVFQGKRKRTWKIKNGTANDRRLRRQTLPHGCEFSKMKVDFCFTKAPIKMPKTKENSIFAAQPE